MSDTEVAPTLENMISIAHAPRFAPVPGANGEIYLCLLDKEQGEHWLRIEKGAVNGLLEELTFIHNKFTQQDAENYTINPVIFETVQIELAMLSGNMTEGNIVFFIYTTAGAVLQTIIGPNLAATLRANIGSVLDSLPDAPSLHILEDAGSKLPGGDTTVANSVKYFGQMYDEKVLAAIGLLVVRTNLLEKRIILLLEYFTNIKAKQARAMYYAIQNTRGRLELVKAAISATGPNKARKVEIDKLFDKIHSIFSQRNALIHADWSIRRGTLKASAIDAAGKRVNNIPANVDSIKRLAYEFQIAAKDVNHLLSSLIREDIARNAAVNPSETL